MKNIFGTWERIKTTRGALPEPNTEFVEFNESGELIYTFSNQPSAKMRFEFCSGDSKLILYPTLGGQIAYTVTFICETCFRAFSDDGKMDEFELRDSTRGSMRKN
jgi:hypothetical protein